MVIVREGDPVDTRLVTVTDPPEVVREVLPVALVMDSSHLPTLHQVPGQVLSSVLLNRHKQCIKGQ